MAKKQIVFTSVIQVDKAELDPNYDISLFRDIKIPKGMAVYHIRNDEIVKSYVEGDSPRVQGPVAPVARSRASSRKTAYVVGGSVLGLALLIFLYARRRRKDGPGAETFESAA